MNRIPYYETTLQNGFWKEKETLLRKVTARAIYEQFQRSGRLEALDVKTWILRLSRGELPENYPLVPHFFWDSDVFKWIEGCAYLLAQKADPHLEDLCDRLIDTVCDNADENGYFNSHFLVAEAASQYLKGESGRRFTDRNAHELYCAGHLMEAGAAYFEATGKRRLLELSARYADYIDKVFRVEKTAAFVTPGHPELELALCRLGRLLEEEKYIRLAGFFVDSHGANPADGPLFEGALLPYNQDNMPLSERREAEGHAVRALYLLCGALDTAFLTDQEALYEACLETFRNTVLKRMYVSGGVGSSSWGEAFTVDFDLPEETAYAESCAAIALAMLGSRLAAYETARGLVPSSLFADTAERVLYNGALSGLSLSGKAFFYENPLKIDLSLGEDRNPSTEEKLHLPPRERQEMFSCSCCPPNLLRFFASVASHAYSLSDDTLFVHQYIASSTERSQLSEEDDLFQSGFSLEVETAYPAEGRIFLTIRRMEQCRLQKVAVRIPSWSRSFTLSRPFELKSGYAICELGNDTEAQLMLQIDMTPRFVHANPKLHSAAGKICLMRGPVLYCLEGIDHPGLDIHTVRVPSNQEVSVLPSFARGKEIGSLPRLHAQGYILRYPQEELLYDNASLRYERTDLTFIPYYTFANRGRSDMTVWVMER